MICPICGKKFGSQVTVLSSVEPFRYTATKCPQCGTNVILKIPKSAWHIINEAQSTPVSNGEYLCHVPGRSEPKVTHPTLQEALTEAKRLIKMQGRAVRIYRTVANVKPVTEVSVEYV